MSTSSVSSTTTYWKTPTTTTTDSSGTTGAGSLDFESFVELLAAELKYQDPQDPVSSTEYVAQMAQFASLDKLNTIGNSMDAYQAYSLIGKSVTYETTDSSGSTTKATGTVDSVTIKNSTPYLNIGSTQIELSSVVSVSDSTTSA